MNRRNLIGSGLAAIAIGAGAGKLAPSTDAASMVKWTPPRLESPFVWYDDDLVHVDVTPDGGWTDTVGDTFKKYRAVVTRKDRGTSMAVMNFMYSESFYPTWNDRYMAMHMDVCKIGNEYADILRNERYTYVRRG